MIVLTLQSFWLTEAVLHRRVHYINLLQSSSSTFPWGNLLSFFAFQEGMLGTPIWTLEG
jgi:hypothetical protein